MAHELFRGKKNTVPLIGRMLILGLNALSVADKFRIPREILNRIIVYFIYFPVLSVTDGWCRFHEFYHGDLRRYC